MKTPENSTFTQGQFLLAMPQLAGSNFEGAVIYMLEHDENGAVGLVINHPLEINIGDILEQIDESFRNTGNNKPVFVGGPVEGSRGFVLHRPSNKSWEGQVSINERLSVTTTADILEAMAKGEDIGDYVITLGYSGWSAGQLEEEMMDGAWLNVQADEIEIFNLPYQDRLEFLSQTLGITYSQLSSSTGHG